MGGEKIEEINISEKKQKTLKEQLYDAHLINSVMLSDLLEIELRRVHGGLVPHANKEIIELGNLVNDSVITFLKIEQQYNHPKNYELTI
ncbi:hypothetical protein HOY36_13285 [Enterococcus sp. MMGLQ5-2]|nr:hypothetical protein [Enterococcus sp. MMGLQ5-1]NPD38313.1 hypothetical protein [Enterococcus sp. MMGLQ5-2]